MNGLLGEVLPDQDTPGHTDHPRRFEVVDHLQRTAVAAGASRRPNGLLLDAQHVARAAAELTAAGLGPVTASRPDFVFEVVSPAYDALRARTLTTLSKLNGVQT